MVQVYPHQSDWTGQIIAEVFFSFIYKAIDVPDAMGFSLVGGHNHCSFPSAQTGQLNAFISKYLQKGSASTADIEQSSVAVNTADYTTWRAPILT